MIRSFSTYLLLIITCSFFTMGLNKIYLDNFVKIQISETVKTTNSSTQNCTFINIMSSSFPEKERSLTGNFDIENEVEVETDVLPTIEFDPSNFNLKSLQSLFLNVYTIYFYTVIKAEFLDIFSPPPNR